MTIIHRSHLIFDIGQFKLVQTLAIHDLQSATPFQDKEYRTAGNKRQILLFDGEYVPETRKNLQLLLEKSDIEGIIGHFVTMFLGDLSNKHKVIGCQLNGLYGCYACFGFKSLPEAPNKPVGNKFEDARWQYGPLKTFSDCERINQDFLKECEELGLDPDSAAGQSLLSGKYYNHRNSPLFMAPNPNDKIQDWFPIDGLHTVPLGCVQDCLKSLEKEFPKEMKRVFTKTNMRNELSNQPGGQWAGSQIKDFWTEKNLSFLERKVSHKHQGKLLVNYLRKTKSLYHMMVQKELNRETFRTVIQDWRDSFDACFYFRSPNRLLSETEKIHHLYR